MNKQEALDAINKALRKALDDDTASAQPGVDLIEAEILDSLDGMVFILELSGYTDKKFPETDLVDLGFYKVDKLVEFLTTA
jgi:acyl carrier protein